MSEPKKQNYLHGAVILTAGVIIMKILGAVYKIPLGNILGDDGFGYFNTAYNIYNLFLTIATAGFPIALSRLISASYTLEKKNQTKKLFKTALIFFSAMGLVCSALMFFFSEELAAFMNGPKSAQSIFALSPAVFFCCALAAFRGYCQGRGNMFPTTVGQVLEVLFKAVVGFILAFAFMKAGKSLPEQSAGAIFGVVAGSIVALAYMAYYKKKHYSEKDDDADDIPEKTGKILGDLIKIGVPITLGSCVMSLVTLIDNKLVLLRLQTAAGFTSEAADTLWGVYSKAMTLYNLPAAFITPLTIAVVPSIAAFVAKQKEYEACEVGESSIRISSLLAMPMGAGLAILSGPIMSVIYPGSHEAGGSVLLFMGIAAFFVCTSLITNAVLQAHGNERLPVISMLAGGAAKIIVNWVLVGNPDINIKGAPIGTIACYAIMCVLNVYFLRRSMKERRPSIKGMFFGPLICTAAMGVCAFAVNMLASRILPSTWMGTALSMLVSIGAGVIVYFVLVIKARAITAEDMALIPKGDKIAKLLHIK